MLRFTPHGSSRRDFLRAQGTQSLSSLLTEQSLKMRGPWELSLVRVGLGGCTFQSLATKERNVSQGTYGTQCGVLGMNHPRISFCNKSTLQGKGTVEGPPQQDWSGGRSGKGRWSAKECVISPGPSEGRPQRELHITAKLFTL